MFLITYGFHTKIIIYTSFIYSITQVKTPIKDIYYINRHRMFHLSYSRGLNMKFSFGQRKIQTVQYTYMLPIPADWIRNMNISKGDALNIVMEADNSLRIIPN